MCMTDVKVQLNLLDSEQLQALKQFQPEWCTQKDSVSSQLTPVKRVKWKIHILCIIRLLTFLSCSFKSFSQMQMNRL